MNIGYLKGLDWSSPFLFRHNGMLFRRKDSAWRESIDET